jgi:hypothetical protein
MTPTFATRWELSVLHCGRFPHNHAVAILLIIFQMPFQSALNVLPNVKTDFKRDL